MNSRKTRTFLLHQQNFSKGKMKIALSDRDLAGLRALQSLGGKISSAAELAAVLNPRLTANQQAMGGGRLIRRLASFGFVQALIDPEAGYQITAAGEQAALGS